MYPSLSESNPIEIVARNIDVSAVSDVLSENDNLWNKHRLRTDAAGPHRNVSDIWVRCLDWRRMGFDPTAFNEPHESTWYPAGEILEIKDAVMDVFKRSFAESMGGILITKVPPGKRVLPHIDHGWHAREYCKVALQIKAHDQQSFCFKTKEVITRTGDIFCFDNSFEHWVINDSPIERITMICCFRINPEGRQMSFAVN